MPEDYSDIWINQIAKIAFIANNKSTYSMPVALRFRLLMCALLISWTDEMTNSRTIARNFNAVME